MEGKKHARIHIIFIVGLCAFIIGNVSGIWFVSARTGERNQFTTASQDGIDQLRASNYSLARSIDAYQRGLAELSEYNKSAISRIDKSEEYSNTAESGINSAIGYIDSAIELLQKSND